MRRRLAGAVLVVWLVVAWAASAQADEVHALAAALQQDPVQLIGKSRSSFSTLSPAQANSLRTEIAKLDPGRIWIAFVSPRSQSALGEVGSPLFAALPAGTVILVADDPGEASTTHFWVGASFEDGSAAQARLSDALNLHKGQDPLVVQLRRAISSFASADAAAGHPALSSGHSVPLPAAPHSSGGSNAGLIVGLVVAGVLLLVGLVSAVPRLRTGLRTAHWRREAAADAHEQANTDFTALGEQIAGLDIDSSMPNASAQGKKEYAQAIACYQDAERHLRQADDEYHFARAVEAIKQGTAHVNAAGELFNAKSDPQGV